MRVLREGSVLAVIVGALVSAGCSGSACDGALCGACMESFVVHVVGASAGATATLEGGTCGRLGSALTCSAPLAPGEQDVTLVVDGVARTVHASIAAAPAGCCTCSPTFETTLDVGGDAGAGRDAAADDAGLACDPSAVTFPAGGSLVEGQLCDDVFACAASAADAAALQAAAPDFICDTTPAAGCTAFTCRFSPSTLDAAELAEVCAVTLLTPRPALTCMIYL